MERQIYLLSLAFWVNLVEHVHFLPGLLGIHNTFLWIRKDTAKDIPMVAGREPLWAQKSAGDGAASQ